MDPKDLMPHHSCEYCGTDVDSPRHPTCERCARIKWEDCGGARDHFDYEGLVYHYNGNACSRMTKLDRENERRRA